VLALNELGIDVAKSTVERYQPKGGSDFAGLEDISCVACE
jgi:hypothetical protein